VVLCRVTSEPINHHATMTYGRVPFFVVLRPANVGAQPLALTIPPARVGWSACWVRGVLVLDPAGTPGRRLRGSPRRRPSGVPWITAVSGGR
jgi:hypothetical protein